MPFVRYTEVQSRIAIVSGTFVSSTATRTADGGEAELVIRYYPWWEREGRTSAQPPPDPAGTRALERELRVHAVDLVATQMHATTAVYALEFRRNGPRAWPYEKAYSVFVNDAFDRERLLDRITARLSVTERDLRPFVGRPSGEPPCRLDADIPASIFGVVRDELDGLGGLPFVPRWPDPWDDLITLECEAGWMVARDFLVDLPEFVHP